MEKELEGEEGGNEKKILMNNSVNSVSPGCIF